MRIGLTGGVASGKSTVAEMLRTLGAHILDADLMARELVEPGQPAFAEIVRQWGPQYLQADGCLDRSLLRERIFSDPAAKKWLESLLHPQIRQLFLDRSQSLQKDLSEAVIVWVVPLLVENHYQVLLDQVLVIDCPNALQIERLQLRPGWSNAQIEAVLAAQLPRAERNAAADYVINNEKDVQALHEAVLVYWEAVHKVCGFA
ncbi:dephospho-CoA kinase [Acidithiobacillus thiooxidans]|uniref:dephospho-CoA kinase n=1 Tax=Acidithiobacillus thiooxidans TaxID=930 RepID=UPI001C06C552|nr:dephospho-CoA kinase [Acidithiobacillus thiooxidans]MBU2842692.1 dephospho-CoA kinase [Acidithiobacillus thiooxidans]